MLLQTANCEGNSSSIYALRPASVITIVRIPLLALFNIYEMYPFLFGNYFSFLCVVCRFLPLCRGYLPAGPSWRWHSSIDHSVVSVCRRWSSLSRQDFWSYKVSGCFRNPFSFSFLSSLCVRPIETPCSSSIVKLKLYFLFWHVLGCVRRFYWMGAEFHPFHFWLRLGLVRKFI